MDQTVISTPRTLDRVRKIVAEHLDKPIEDVRPDSNFIDDLGSDSLDNVELIMRFEEEFEIVIADEVAENITTVQQAVTEIERLVVAAAAD